MADIHTILKKKTELLCKGVFLDEKLINQYKSQGIEIDFGRKGGAGPSGGRYFLLEDNKTLVNVALWDNSKRSNLLLGEFKENQQSFEVYDKRDDRNFCNLKILENPKYYGSDHRTSDGIEMKKIALVHGIDCVATTIYQKCAYWECGEGCQFCGIQVSLDSGATIVEKTAKQISEVMTAAKQENRCKHVTLTSGSPAGEDKGAERYIQVLQGIKKVHPDIPLHIQLEPVKYELLSRLKEAGADTIGIHMEVMDDLLRSVITPGKYKIPYEKFTESWKNAIEIFGENQVETYLLTGFGESRIDFIDDLEKVVSLGVIPFITPVRCVPGRKKVMPTMNYNALLEIYLNAAKLLREYGVNPLENKAGCVKCGGCSAINEAYKAI